MQINQIKRSPVWVAIILLVMATALIHLTLNFPDVMFILNGLGFLGLAAALYIPLPVARDHRRLVRYVFIGYCLLTAALWGAIGMRVLIGYTATAIELLLAILLWIDRK